MACVSMTFRALSWGGHLSAGTKTKLLAPGTGIDSMYYPLGMLFRFERARVALKKD